MKKNSQKTALAHFEKISRKWHQVNMFGEIEKNDVFFFSRNYEHNQSYENSIMFKLKDEVISSETFDT